MNAYNSVLLYAKWFINLYTSEDEYIYLNK